MALNDSGVNAHPDLLTSGPFPDAIMWGTSGQWANAIMWGTSVDKGE